MVTKKELEEELVYVRQMKDKYGSQVSDLKDKLDKQYQLVEELKDKISTLDIENRDNYIEMVEEQAKRIAYRDALKIVASGGE